MGSHLSQDDYMDRQRLPGLFLFIPVGLGWVGWAQILATTFPERMDLRLRSPLRVQRFLFIFLLLFWVGDEWTIVSLAVLVFFLPFLRSGFFEIKSFLNSVKIPPFNHWL